MGKKYVSFDINLEGSGVEPKWYTLVTMSNYEAKVEKNIKMIIDNGISNGQIVDVFAPIKQIKTVKEYKNGKKKIITKNEKILPNYVFVKAQMNIDMWKMINNITGVKVILTSSGTPIPVDEKEIESIKLNCKPDNSELIA